MFPPLSSFGDDWYPSCDLSPSLLSFLDDEQWKAPNPLENPAYLMEKAYNRADIDI